MSTSTFNTFYDLDNIRNKYTIHKCVKFSVAYSFHRNVSYLKIILKLIHVLDIIYI